MLYCLKAERRKSKRKKMDVGRSFLKLMEAKQQLSFWCIISLKHWSCHYWMILWFAKHPTNASSIIDTYATLTTILTTKQCLLY